MIIYYSGQKLASLMFLVTININVANLFLFMVNFHSVRWQHCFGAQTPLCVAAESSSWLTQYFAVVSSRFSVPAYFLGQQTGKPHSTYSDNEFKKAFH